MSINLITESITLNNTNIYDYSWPVSVGNGSENIIITFGTNLIFDAHETNDVSDFYFIIVGSNVSFNGNCKKITITYDATNPYPGLISNIGSELPSYYTNIYVHDLDIVSTSPTSLNALQVESGWFFQNNFNNGIGKFLSSDGLISTNGGGVYGAGSFNCKAINCFSSGTITDSAGGIFGSYCLNCVALNCYSVGEIGTDEIVRCGSYSSDTLEDAHYAGGIFGAGANHTKLLKCYENELVYTTLYCYIDKRSSYAINCYSIGNISESSGGIFGFFAQKTLAKNCYSVGFGSSNITSGGIYAPNFIPFSENDKPYCCATNCYTAGGNLSLDGIFSFVCINNKTNTKKYCYSEQYDCKSGITVWKDSHANKILKAIDNVWIDVDLSSEHVPYLLRSFDKKLYCSSYDKHKKSCGVTRQGMLHPSYYLISVNNEKTCKKFEINHSNGRVSFSKLELELYKLKIVNGIKINIGSNFTNNYYTFIDYNINNLFLKYNNNCDTDKKTCSSSVSSTEIKCKRRIKQKTCHKSTEPKCIESKKKTVCVKTNQQNKKNICINKNVNYNLIGENTFGVEINKTYSVEQAIKQVNPM
jgi:hypothetical protein